MYMNENNGVLQQILHTLFRIENKLGKVDQRSKDLDTFANRINDDVKRKVGRIEFQNVKQMIDNIASSKINRTNCSVMKLHIAINHNPDAELGKKVRKTGNWISKFAFWRS